MFTKAMRKKANLFSTVLAAGMLSISAHAASADDVLFGSYTSPTGKPTALAFSSTDPQHPLSAVVKGLPNGYKILCGVNRPANNQVYIVAGNGNAQQLFITDLSKLNNHVVKVSPVGGPFSPALSGDFFGCDVNPTVDRIRIISDANHNFSVNPNDGTVTAQTNLAYVAGDPNAGRDPGATAAAYINKDNDPATGTTLYDIDCSSDMLVIQNPPATGQLTTVGATGVSTFGSLDCHLEIVTQGTTNTAYAALPTADMKGTNFYTVDLTTGAANLIGQIGKNLKVGSLTSIGSF
jgi:hypothetical protein